MAKDKTTSVSEKLKKKTAKKRGSKPGKPKRTPTADLFKPDARKGKDPVVPDLFDRRVTKGGGHEGTGPGGAVAVVAEDLGGVDKFAHDTNLLKVEWAIKYPLLSPRIFLIEKKGYSTSQADKIIGGSGGAMDWNAERAKILDKMTESTVLRHIDQMAEVQETHIKASKIGLAKAVEMLSKLSVDPAKDEEGKLIKDAKGKVVHKGFRSIDLLNIMSSIEKAQQIYRRAMGLPNDENGMAQILEKVSLVQNNLTVNHEEHHHHEEPREKSDKEKMIDKLEYEDIMEFIEFRREQKARLKAKEEEKPA